MKYLYVLLVIIVIYYIILSLLENYSSSEHFDPSLVPVSSIVTLAKIAQKIIDGGGTLTNPGNLQIGTPSAPGSFAVTGNTVLGLPGTSTTITGLINFDNDVSINSNLSAGNGIYIQEGNLALNNGTINMISDGTGGLYLSQNNNKDGPGTRLTTDDINVKDNLTVKNAIQVGEVDSNNIKFKTDGIQISSKVNTRISSNGLIVDKLLQAPGDIRSPLLSNNEQLQLESSADVVYIAGNKGVTIGKINNDPNSTDNLNSKDGNLNVEDRICMNGECLSQDDFMRLKIMLRIFRYDERIKGALYCNTNTPVVLIDGSITDRGQTAFPQKVGSLNSNQGPFTYINNDDTGKTNYTTQIDNRMNYVYIYPGYGFKGWTGYNKTNDNGYNNNKPLELNNTTSELLYYILSDGTSSTAENIIKYGINLNTPDRVIPSTTTNLWDSLSSFEVYKL